MERAPSQVRGVAGYVVPFAVFIGFLAMQPVLPVPQWARFGIELALILGMSRGIVGKAPARPVLSVLLGMAVFLIWVAPDQLIPGYRSWALFSNSIVGHVSAHTAAPRSGEFAFLIFRVLNSVVAVPILEELFWRGFLMRWLIDREFRSVPLGAYSMQAFWIVAVLFASEHGSYWDVGLVTGVIYNWWMVRTRNLTDCIIAHAVTNACLAAFVIGAGQWQYWL